MSPNPQRMPHDWLTVVTMRINFRQRTFSPSFRMKPNNARGPRTGCSCSQLGSLHSTPMVEDLANGWLPVETFTVRFMLTSAERVEQAKQLCMPHQRLEFASQDLFRYWILSLAVQLSELCKAKHLQDRGSFPQRVSLRPFMTGSVTMKAVCEDVRRLLMAPLTPSEKEAHGMGHVYILRSQLGLNTMGELKIGFSKYHPEHRSHELARCLARPEIISYTPLLPHAKRLESIIHTELQAHRKIQSCAVCLKDHREWFTLSHADSREIVTRWSKWILQQPFRDGELTREWENYITTKDFEFVDESKNLAELWKTIIDDFPEEETNENESQRVGKYLNDCYWDVTCHQFGIDRFGKDFCEGLRKDAYPEGSTDSSSWDEYMNKFDNLAQKLRKLEMDTEADISKTQIDRDNDKSPHPIEKAFRSSISGNSNILPDTKIKSICGSGTPLSQMFHPETAVRHLINLDNSPGPVLHLIRHQEVSSKAGSEYLLELHHALRNATTGVFSVSSPSLGVTESPLGDATLLPVVALKHLEHLYMPVANWIGMNPTNAGFQYVQEAYQNGEWLGGKPRFRLPRAYRKAGYQKLPTEHVPNQESLRVTKDKEAERNDAVPARQGHSDEETSRSKFQLSIGPDGHKLTWTQPINDEFIRRVNETVEELRNGERANVERKLAKSLRHFGVDAFYDIPEDDIMTDSDSSLSTGPFSDAEEGEALHPKPGSAFPTVRSNISTLPTKRKGRSNSISDFITAKKAKQWLESM